MSLLLVYSVVASKMVYWSDKIFQDGSYKSNCRHLSFLEPKHRSTFKRILLNKVLESCLMLFCTEIVVSPRTANAVYSVADRQQDNIIVQDFNCFKCMLNLSRPGGGQILTAATLNRNNVTNFSQIWRAQLVFINFDVTMAINFWKAFFFFQNKTKENYLSHFAFYVFSVPWLVLTYFSFNLGTFLKFWVKSSNRRRRIQDGRHLTIRTACNAQRVFFGWFVFLLRDIFKVVPGVCGLTLLSKWRHLSLILNQLTVNCRAGSLVKSITIQI